MRRLLAGLAIVAATIVVTPGVAQAGVWKTSGHFTTYSACETSGIDLVRLHPDITNYRCIGRGWRSYVLQTYWV